MSRFYGELGGQARTTATRRGSPNSPSWAHVRGWNFGVRVEMRVGPDDEDVADVTLTGGSNGNARERLIGTFSRKDLEEHNR